MPSVYEAKLQSLETSDKKAYGRLKSIYKAKFKELDEDEYLKEVESNLNIESNHLMIINSLISMFYSCKELGYQYFSVDPLFEINGNPVKNFDIIFVRYENSTAKIILVEVKSSLANIGKEISDFEDTKAVYKANKTEFENFVGETITHEDFVFAIPFSYKDDLLRHITQNRLSLQEFIIWAVDPFKSKVYEIKQSTNHTLERTSKRVHLYADLESLFSGQPFTNTNPLSFTPKGHIIHILQFFYTEIYHRLKKEKRGSDEINFDFHIDILKMLVSCIRETDNHQDAQKEKIIKLVLDFGEKYGVFKRLTRDEYRLKFTNKPYGIKEVLCKEHVNQKRDKDAQKQALEEFSVSEKDNQESLLNF